MQDYKELVERCREKRLNEVLQNSSLSHARIIIENLLQHALNLPAGETREVCLATASANPVVYSGMTSLAKEVLDKGIKIRVLLTDSDASPLANPFLEQIRSHKNGRVKTVGSDALSVPHFMLSGESAYRLETDSSAHIAIANFNEPIIAERLHGRFDQAWEPALTAA